MALRVLVFGRAPRPLLQACLLRTTLAGLCLASSVMPVATAGVGPYGVASDNVEYVELVPFEAGTAVGARLVGDFLYVSSLKNFSIYDVADPLNPVLLSITPYVKDTASAGSPVRFENEDVATNGRIFIISETLPVNVLWIFDVEDKTNPVLLSRTPGIAEHTMSCVLSCRYLYGSTGSIVDLADPRRPEIVGDWSDGQPVSNGHDVTEVAPGLILTSSQPILLLDARRRPEAPTAVVTGTTADGRFIHSTGWPALGSTPVFLATGETNFNPRCSETSGAFMTWDTTQWRKTRTFRLIDEYRVANGTEVDGSPPANVSGCSSHWFDDHPDFDGGGGLVGVGFYDHGVRFLEVTRTGSIEERGWFLGYGGNTNAVYWLTNEIVYAIDANRGIEILRFEDIRS